MFQQACSNASDKKDESVYVEFCLLLGEETPINVWHVKQNMLKNYTNGKKKRLENYASQIITKRKGYKR